MTFSAPLQAFRPERPRSAQDPVFGFGRKGAEFAASGKRETDRAARPTLTREASADMCVAPSFDYAVGPESKRTGRHEEKWALYRRLYQDLKPRFPRG